MRHARSSFGVSDHRPRQFSGFTLVELLVVIVVLAVLIAVAVPSYLGYKQRTQDSASKQNLTVAWKLARAEATSNESLYPAAAALRTALIASEPQMEFATGTNCLAADGAGSQTIVLDSDSIGDESLVLYNRSSSGQVFRLSASNTGTPQIDAVCDGGSGGTESSPAAPSAGSGQPVLTSGGGPSGDQPQQGEPTTVAPGDWESADGNPLTVTQQWQSGPDNDGPWADLGGASTGLTYAPLAADVGSWLRTELTICGDGGCIVRYTDPTGPVLPPVPVQTGVAPDLTPASLALEGSPISASNGDWAGGTATPSSYEYQWQVSHSPFTDIAGASAASFTPRAADVDGTLRICVRATNAGGTSAARCSAASSAVEAKSPLASADPAIGGQAREGGTLTASKGTWSTSAPLGISYGYQWRRCDDQGGACVTISGATAVTHVVRPIDVDGTIRVVVTASNQGSGGRSATATSTPTEIAEAATPVNTALPTISGLVQQDELLTAVRGTWVSGAPGGLSYGYRWQLSPNGTSGWTDIAGATTVTHTLTASSVGGFIRVLVTASNQGSGGLTADAASLASGEVLPSTPESTTAPSVTGSVTVGQSLSGSNGAWSRSPSSFALSWQRADLAAGPWTAIAGQTAATYVLVAADYAKFLRVRVIATNTGGDSDPAFSDPAGPIIDAAPVLTGGAGLPAISGLAKEGQSLSVSNGSWESATTPTYTSQWRRCDSAGAACVDIAGATAASYAIVLADVGKTLRAVVTATNTAGATPSTSAQTAVVTQLAPVSSAAPTVSGSAAQGQILTATAGSWTSATTPTYGYQWQHSADGTTWTNALGGGSATVSYSIAYSAVTADSDIDKFLRVCVTATNTGGLTSACSAQTVRVLAAAPTNSIVPSLAGTPTVGTALTAANGSWSTQSPSGLSYAYRWDRCQATYPAAVAATPNLAGYWRLGQASYTGAGTVLDSGPNSLPGGNYTSGGISFAQAGAIAGDTNTSITLDGAGGYARIPWASALDAQTTASGLTMEAWVKRTGTAFAPILEYGHASDGRIGPHFWAYPTASDLWFNTGSNAIKATNVLPAIGVWYHVAATYDGSTSRIYVNGIEVAAGFGGTGALVTTTGMDLMIGKRVNSSYLWNGSIDEPALYTRALAAGEVTDHYRVAGDAKGCAAIAGATAQSYTPVTADASRKLQVTVTATNIGAGAATASASSVQSATAVGVAPANTLAPSITQTPLDGQPVVVSRGGWTGAPQPSFAYQWQRCGYASTVRLDTPVGYWRMNQQLIGPVPDSSGFGRDGTMNVGNGSAQVGALSGDPDSSTYFSGGNYVSVPDNAAFSMTSNFSVELWYKHNASSGDWERLVGKGDMYARPYGVWLEPTSGKLLLQIYSAPSTALVNLYSDGAVNNGQWHHIVATYNGSTAAIFIDGAASGSVATAGSAMVTGSPVTIGHAVAMHSGANGWIDDVAIYPSALSSARVSAHYSSGTTSGGSCADIAGATGPSYTPPASDFASSLKTRITASNGFGSPVTLTTAGSTAVASGPPLNTAAPTISGSAAPAFTQTATTGSWSATSAISYAYQWQRALVANRLIPNGDIETDTSGWTANGLATIARSTVRSKFGGSSLLLTATAASNTSRAWASANGETLSLGDRFTASAWVYAEGAVVGRTLQVLLWEVGGASGAQVSTGGEAYPTLLAGWNRYTITGTIVRADRTDLQLYLGSVNASGWQVGESVYFDGVQLEEAASASAYTEDPWVNLAGATAASYQVQTADVGYQLRARVTATTGGGSENAFSAASAVVAHVVPQAVTGAAAAVASTTATLNGTLYPNNFTVNYSYQYGTTTGYGSTAGPYTYASAAPTAAPIGIGGLAQGTTYHYRLVATGPGGTSYGADVAFTTPVPIPSASVSIWLGSWSGGAPCGGMSGGQSCLQWSGSVSGSYDSSSWYSSIHGWVGPTGGPYTSGPGLPDYWSFNGYSYWGGTMNGSGSNTIYVYRI